MFEQLNRLNLKLQGNDRNVFHLMDCLRVFLAKLQNWQRKVNAGNVAMFENLSTVLDENEDHLLDPSLKTEITQHLKSLESELKKYFPEFEEEDGKLVRNPFSGTLDIATIPNDVQDEFLDLKNDSAAKDLYEERSLTVFWRVLGRTTLVPFVPYCHKAHGRSWCRNASHYFETGCLQTPVKEVLLR
ncbi:Zinc finger BED domain-containing protein 5-like 7 [Homarus americanus]|uniref:Zinc finger BED domain-containing protein 5-like 7 n=1 Tax=Homarus americanus TaxID=6706 RepID=A0A8J5JDJ8_HOMAM|nr:Zinc finger BED domain-containing protein 5-like 7 [Homarus americanus]